MVQRRSPKSGSKDSAFDVLEKMTVTVMFDSKPKRLTLAQALEFKTYEEAVAGKVGAVRDVVGWIIEREDARAKFGSAGRFQIHFEHHPSNSIDAAMVLLGIVSQKLGELDGYLELEPWTAQAAFDRSPRLALSQSRLRQLKGAVRDADAISWSRVTSDDG